MKKITEKKLFKNDYGYFSEDGKEYVITRPDTPRPWVNVMSNGRYGVIVSQTGGGYSWMDNAQINRITRWEQDLIRDEWGKFIFLRDDEKGTGGSLTWKPTCSKFSSFECRHGVGFTTLEAVWQGIRGKMTLFVPPNETHEIWTLELENLGKKQRKISVFTFFEWLLGRWPDSHREFHRLFIETQYDEKLQGIFAEKRFWDIPNQKGQLWNNSYSYVAFHACSRKPSGFECDKEEFVGKYGAIAHPKAVKEGKLGNHDGKWNDSVASLHLKFNLKPGKAESCVFVTGLAENKESVRKKVLAFSDPAKAAQAFKATQEFWKETLSGLEVETPDPALNIMTNTWLKYQAISGRIWGRTGYYQGGGAYGFRDQLQDSHIFLPLNSDRTAAQIKLHAEHQYADGTVQHWWQNLAPEASGSHHSDNLLWLPFVLVNYLKETAHFSILHEQASFLKNEGSASIYEHAKRAILKSLSRKSPRGIPLILEGDWNDGLNACGRDGKGESVWLGHFLYGILNEFSFVAMKENDLEFVALMKNEAQTLKQAINEVGWDGEWYWRATTDSGKVLGSHECKEGKIFINAQTWSLINGVAEGERAKLVKKMMEKYLYKNYGPILFYPAYKSPDIEVGYLTRYPAGMRENGGLYTHAGVWGIWAECEMKDAAKAYETYQRVNPIYRGENPDLYWSEPYVLPGNVDGPESPNYGRGGWSWYTGSAAWCYRITGEWILGVRPDYNGLVIDPCIPKKWDGFKMTRRFRGDIYQIEVKNPKHVSGGIWEIKVDGFSIKGNVVQPVGDGKAHSVEVMMGKLSGEKVKSQKAAFASAF
ncbi:MAG: glycosyl transferase family 36 [Chlamydiae bacterium]|nr:glycosyl transferase family 36 [Chlamydiota bacterium]MBI3276395.1 glycosyl transferase family 36 [Chlamydiota bacterium]